MEKHVKNSVEKIQKNKTNLLHRMSLNKNGITLIALIITVVIIVILASVAMAVTMSNGGLLGRVSEAKFKNKMAAYKEQVNLYVGWQVTETLNTDTSRINSGNVLKEMVESEIITDINKEDVSIEIESIIKNIKKDDKDSVVVYKGELCYVANEDQKDSKKYVKWCEDIGVKVLTYTKPVGIVVRNGNYELVNGIYVSTPKLDNSFVAEKTRYLNVDANGNLVPGAWIDSSPSSNWYDYKNQKWANIYVESDGKENYYVWIPRYCYKIGGNDIEGNTIGLEKTDVRFINVKDDSHILVNNDNSETTYTWKQLEDAGYKIPEAFEWEKSNSNGTTDKIQLSGYWVNKYTVGEMSDLTINYDMSVVQGKIKISNITLNTDITNANPIVKYTIALNGKIVQTVDDVNNINTKSFTVDNLKKGNNYINLTGLNTNGEIVGSLTKVYEPAIVNAPDLSGFDKNVTYYVTYDENDNEHSTIPITEAVPSMWYEYGEARWANIVVRENGNETYYTWIPRYAYFIVPGQAPATARTTVKFLNGTNGLSAEDTALGYQIPEAFTWQKTKTDGTSEDIQLTGYWVNKYTAGDTGAPEFDAEVAATSNSITVKQVTGSKKTSGQVYNYYIKGEKKASNNDGSQVEITGLKAGTKYTVLVEVRKTDGSYVGSTAKTITTVAPNKPDLSGFNENNTYYVVYDETGTNIVSETTKIKNDGSNAPTNWYDYGSSKWANIVVKEGSLTTYYTWIPRYEYQVTATQAAQPAAGRTEVRFIEGTAGVSDEDKLKGYAIPEAFTWQKTKSDGTTEDVQLKGYWVNKYTAGE